jgi:hypothetical protein
MLCGGGDVTRESTEAFSSLFLARERVGPIRWGPHAPGVAYTPPPTRREVTSRLGPCREICRGRPSSFTKS